MTSLESQYLCHERLFFYSLHFMLALQQYTFSLLLNLPSIYWWTIITPSMNKMLEMAKHENDSQVKKTAVS